MSHSVSTGALRLVHDVPDCIVDQTSRPLIREGEYNATYVRHEVVEIRKFHNAPKLFLWCRIVDPGEAFGVELYRAYPIKKKITNKRFALNVDSDLLLMLARVLHLKQRPDRISLHLLSGRVLVVKVGTVTKNGRGIELPTWARYSVVRDILRAETEGPGHL